MIDAAIPLGGWQLDLADHRDFTPCHCEVREIFDAANSTPLHQPLPRAVDWREFARQSRGCREISSAALAGWLLFEYFQMRSFGQREETSPEFVDRVARRLSGAHEGCPLSLRQVFRAIARCGLPPDWLDRDAVARGEPMHPLLFTYQAQSGGLQYVRLDDSRTPGEVTLRTVKQFLAAGFAVACGTSLFESSLVDDDIAPPTIFDRWGYATAVVAIGFDDDRVGRSCRGALSICQFCGDRSQSRRFRWLPYCYIEEKLARDCWTLVRPAWLASGEFQRPSL
jgi:hypothetical protein